MRPSSPMYDAVKIMMIIIIHVRWGHYGDNHHHFCMMRWSSWWRLLSFVYDAIIIMMTIIIICVWCNDYLDNDHHHPSTRKSASFVYDAIIITMTIMVTQHIPTSQIPTRWESDIMMKGGNMTQSNSHHTHIYVTLSKDQRDWQSFPWGRFLPSGAIVFIFHARAATFLDSWCTFQ